MRERLRDLRENNLKVQESNKSALHRVNNLICTPNKQQPSSIAVIRPGKQINPKQNNPVAHLRHLYFIYILKQWIVFSRALIGYLVSEYPALVKSN